MIKNIDLFGKIMCVLRFNNYLLTSSYEGEINVWNINDLINKQKDIDLNVNINPKKVFVFKSSYPILKATLLCLTNPFSPKA